MTRSQRLFSNTISSLLYEITAIICGFILPRAMLSSYGSEVNGLVSSISQFLGFISLLEMGVGSVIQSSLYRPLANSDWKEVSCIVASGQRFFTRIARILIAYTAVLMLVFPYVGEHDFGFVYTATLVVAMSISSFAQYYFGSVNGLLLNADQHGYVSFVTQLLTLITNTFACVSLIQAGASIHMVKMTTSLIFLLRPLLLSWYVRRNYPIDRKIKYEGEPIEQKWNGIAQHVSSVVLGNTDTVVLTIFSTLSNVSIYSVYNLVISGVKKLVLSMTGGVQSLMGEYWAKDDKPRLKQLFNWFEWVLHTGVTCVFSVTAVLIVPFVAVYTSGIDDANYIQPLFAVLLVLANALHSLRLPYNVLILACGHYRQTQWNYVISAIINIILSVILVKPMGLAGVAIGTIVAMGYQTIWMARYDTKNLLNIPVRHFVKQIMVDLVAATIIYISGVAFFALEKVSWTAWIVMAVKVSLMAFTIALILNCIFYPSYVRKCLMTVIKMVHTLFNRGG